MSTGAASRARRCRGGAQDRTGAGRDTSLGARRRRLLDSHPWAHETAALSCLGFTFSVRTDDARLGDLLDDLYVGCRDDRQPEHRLSIRSTRTSRGSRFALYLDDRRCDTTAEPGLVLPLVAWHVNRQAIAGSDDLLLLHAAGAARAGRAVVLAGDSGAGKSTLVAALDARGFEYLSDEIVALDPLTGLLMPYAKPIALEAGSWEPLADLRPEGGPEALRYLTRTWMVPPRAPRREPLRTAPGEGAGAPLIVFPSYTPGAANTLTTISRAQAASRLSGLAFNLATWRSRGVDALVDLAGGAECRLLEFDDLETACSSLEGALKGTAAASPSPAAEPERAGAGGSDVHARIIDGEAVIWDGRSASVHRLNAPATVVWRAWQDCRERSSTSVRVAALVGAPIEEVRRDVEATLDALDALDLLGATFPSA